MPSRNAPAPTVLIVPGLGGSGPDHWQSLWEKHEPAFRRVEQADWDKPALDEWVNTLEAAVQAAGGPVVLVAHSLACSLVSHWAGCGSVNRIAGALLVSPSDIDSEAHTPPEVRGFSPMPLTPLPFPAVVVASANDPYVDFERARKFARSWNAQLVEVGDQGHINTASGHGEWREGRSLLARMIG
jgi:uncharacterized protein